MRRSPKTRHLTGDRQVAETTVAEVLAEPAALEDPKARKVLILRRWRTRPNQKTFRQQLR